MQTASESTVVWKISWASLAVIALSLAALFLVYFDGLDVMVGLWTAREEYSHGPLIPFIVMFLVWQKKDVLERLEFTGSWAGLALVLLGLVMFFLSELGGVYVVMQYAFIVALLGLVLSFTGKKAFRTILVPLLILLFMIPLPGFFYNDLSTKLQLISSQIGVFVIRLFDISVYLEGNVIDLGNYKLQVVEACNGLRYLFPLTTLGFIAAYFFSGSLWKKAVIFLSTIPITVLMNSMRIGLIGVTVEYWGIEMADGFLHDFEGWVVFMGCISVLVVEMWILARIGKNRLPLREAFGLDFPEPAPKGAVFEYRKLPASFLASTLGMFIAVLGLYFVLDKRFEDIPERKPYSQFPLTVGEWRGKDSSLEQIYIDTLKLTDYALISFENPEREAINFYSAYYASQRKGASTHSPRACLPGGGWYIVEHETHRVDGVEIGGVPLAVNRLIIQKGEIRQLVYYWFQQRGRIIDSEYMVKWYFFVDSVFRNRSDGALIRMTTVLPPHEDIESADMRLTEFTESISSIVPEYVPD